MAEQTQNAEKTMSDAKKKNTRTALFDESAQSSLYSDADTLLILAALKYFSSPERPLSPQEISNIIISLLEKSDKTIKRKLSSITALFEAIDTQDMDSSEPDDDEDPQYRVARLLRMTFGGSFHVQPFSSEKSHKKYYFKPLFEKAHLDMINSSIISNQYLSDTERSYLLQMISLLGTMPFIPSDTPDNLRPNTKIPDLQDICDLAPEPLAPQPSKDFELLERINLLYRAIANDWKISMTHGSYQKVLGKRQPELVPQKPEKPYQLNPYALFFDAGHHYLLATKSGDTRPWHFRIDRICEVSYLPDPENPGQNAKRDRLPDSLSCYWDKNGFNQELYSLSHPLMAFYDAPKIIECHMQGDYIALSAIIDAFGRENVLIGPSTKENGKKLFSIWVNAQYQSLLFFCAQQHMLVTVLSPDELVQDVKAKLRESLERYN